MHNKNNIKAILACCALLAVGAAHASQTDSNTGTLHATATVSPECAVAEGTAFTIAKLHMIDAATAAQDTTNHDNATGTINAICTAGTPTPMLRFTSGNAGATNTFRLKGADGTYIVYTLYEGTDTTGTQITHDNNAAFTGFTADGNQQPLSVTMDIDPTARANAGIQQYTDTITITTSYGP